MRIFIKVICGLIISAIIYFLASISIESEGTILFGQESIILTLRKPGEIDQFDYHISNENWYWIGDNSKINSLYDQDTNFRAAIDKSSCVQVKVRFVNLFYPSNASYVINARIPKIYLYSVKYQAKCY